MAKKRRSKRRLWVKLTRPWGYKNAFISIIRLESCRLASKIYQLTGYLHWFTKTISHTWIYSTVKFLQWLSWQPVLILEGVNSLQAVRIPVTVSRVCQMPMIYQSSDKFLILRKLIICNASVAQNLIPQLTTLLTYCHCRYRQQVGKYTVYDFSKLRERQLVQMDRGSAGAVNNGSNFCRR